MEGIKAETPDFVRYVAYSEIHGVYLGNGHFSRKEFIPITTLKNTFAEKPETAIVFKDQGEASEEIVRVNQKLGQLQDQMDFPVYRLIEVLPSSADGRATSKDCRDRLLPGW